MQYRAGMKWIIMMGLLAGCTSTALTGEPDAWTPDANLAENTYGVAELPAPDVTYHMPDITADIAVDAPVPDCGDCMARSCSDCLRYCPGVGCVAVDELGCGECGAECAGGEVCVGRDLDETCTFRCVLL